MTQEVAMVFIETLDDDDTLKNKSVVNDDDEKYIQLSQPDTSWKMNVDDYNNGYDADIEELIVGMKDLSIKGM